MKAGVLALQGDFREHAVALASVGASPVEVRTPADLAGVDLLVLPGVSALAARAYAWVADHRYVLPGGTPACAPQLPAQPQ